MVRTLAMCCAFHVQRKSAMGFDFITSDITTAVTYSAQCPGDVASFVRRAREYVARQGRRSFSKQFRRFRLPPTLGLSAATIFEKSE
jgi:hypothetical protein